MEMTATLYSESKPDTLVFFEMAEIQFWYFPDFSKLYC